MANAKEDGQKDEISGHFCDPCKIDDDEAIAVSYCEECNEYLCKNCHKAHKRLAATRNHAVKESDYLQGNSALKTNVTELQEKCSAHPAQVITHFCASHNEICCTQCLGHKMCNDVKSIADYFDNFDMHQEEKKLKSKMRTLKDDVSKTMTLVQVSLKAIECSHDEAKLRMLEAKRSAFDHIESIYNALGDDLNKIRQKDLETILPYKFKCNAVLFDMNTLESYFSDKTKYSKTQLLFAIRKADAKVDTICHELSEIKCNKNLNFRRYRFRPDVDIISLKTNPSTFGKLDVQNDAIKSAAKHTSLHIKDVNDDKNCRITGLTLISSNHLVAADNLNLSVKLIDANENKVISTMKLESAPWDVTLVSDNKVAVTIPEKKMVELLSIDENLTFDRTCEKHITCSGICYGITKYNETILVTVTQGGIAKLEQYDFEGTLLKTVNVNASMPQYVVCSPGKSRIYISDNSKHIVELKSEEFTQIDRLTFCGHKVTGMTTDSTGILYYCESCYNEIYLVVKQKRKQQNLISDKTPYPKCLAFCNETSRLFVGLDGNEISVYYVF